LLKTIETDTKMLTRRDHLSEPAKIQKTPGLLPTNNNTNNSPLKKFNP